MLLAEYIIGIHDKHFRRPNSRRLLLQILFVQFLICVLYNVSFIFRRNYYRNFNIRSWYDSPAHACDGNFIGYGHEFVWLKYARYDDRKSTFHIRCESGLPKYWFYKGKDGTPYSGWLSRMDTDFFELPDKDSIHTRVTMVVRRNEAHNLYHTMCEFYNMFLLIKEFNLHPKNVDVLFMDSRPPSVLDSTWELLFGNILRHDVISSEMVFKDLIWIPIGYESPLNFHLLHDIPFVEEFHQFFIKSVGIHATKPKDCAHLNYTLVLRHDYISHPERVAQMKGRIQRKISNEDDVLRNIRTAIGPQHRLKGVLLEQLSMREQVEVFANTDVLIGMHGAGLSHVMSLPRHATVLELFPYSYRRRAAYYFQAFTLWRHMKYVSWTNSISEYDVDSFSTRVSLPEISQLAVNIRNSMCPPSV